MMDPDRTADFENDVDSQERELAQAREEFDASLREASGKGRSVLTRVVIPVALGSAVAGGIVSAVLLSRLLRRQVVLLQFSAAPEPETSGSNGHVRALFGAVLAASARAILPHVAEVVAQKAAEQVTAHFAPAGAKRHSQDGGPHSGLHDLG